MQRVVMPQTHKLVQQQLLISGLSTEIATPYYTGLDYLQTLKKLQM